MRLTTEGCYYAVIMVCVFISGLFREVNLLFIIAGMMVGPLIMNYIMARWTLQKLNISVQMPENCFSQKPCTLSITLHNPTRWKMWAINVTVTVMPQDPHSVCLPMKSTLFFPGIIHHSQSRLHFNLKLPCRGEYFLTDVALYTSFPFGLFQLRHKVNVNGSFYALPRIDAHVPNLARKRPVHSDTDSQHRILSGRSVTEFLGVRRWQSGDPLHRIHWRTSARRNEPVIRLYEKPHEETLALLIDFWIPENMPDTQWHSYAIKAEETARLGASVLNTLASRGERRVTLGIRAKKEMAVTTHVSSLFLRETLIQLALAQCIPDSVYSLQNMIEKMRNSGAMANIKVPVLFISSRPDHFHFHGIHLQRLRDQG